MKALLFHITMYALLCALGYGIIELGLWLLVPTKGLGVVLIGTGCHLLFLATTAFRSITRARP